MNIEDAEYFIEDLQSIRKDVSSLNSCVSMVTLTLDRLIKEAQSRLDEWETENPRPRTIDDDRAYDEWKFRKAVGE